MFYTWQHESCSIWSHVTTSVPVYDNCTGCQSLNESQALSSRPQRGSWTSAGLHYWLTSASHHHFIAVLVASRKSWRLCRATDKSKTRRSSILHCCTIVVEPTADLFLKWHTYHLQSIGDFSNVPTAPNNACCNDCVMHPQSDCSVAQ